MDQETLGPTISIGVILGWLLPILGGVIGTYSIRARATKGPRERAFVVRAIIWNWIGITLFLLGMWLTSDPYKYVLIAIFIVALVLAVRCSKRRLAVIREEESRHA